jgi:hypothetical protein
MTPLHVQLHLLSSQGHHLDIDIQITPARIMTLQATSGSTLHMECPLQRWWDEGIANDLLF